MEEGRRLRPDGELPSLGAFGVGVKHEAVGVDALAQQHPGVRKTVLVHRAEGHRLRIVDLGGGGLLEPKPEQGDRIFSFGEVTGF